MQKKQIQYKPVGMNRDLAASSFNTEFSFENRNIRFTAADENTQMAIVNEKGTADTGLELKGVPVGYAIVDKKIVLFTTAPFGIDTLDRIYLIYFASRGLTGDMIYLGNLNFSPDSPLETLAVYENQNAIKVYWTDGINQPRVINIANTYNNRSYYSGKPETTFDFVSTIGNGVMEVTKLPLAAGTFSPGTIQYACTYFNNYGQETNIFQTSSLYYIAHEDRGASPEEKVSNAFKINLKDLDTNFDYVRIYSIHRTSMDAVPSVRKVVDLPVKDIMQSQEEITFEEIVEVGEWAHEETVNLPNVDKDTVITASNGESMTLEYWVAWSGGACKADKIDAANYPGDPWWYLLPNMEGDYVLPLSSDGCTPILDGNGNSDAVWVEINSKKYYGREDMKTANLMYLALYTVNGEELDTDDFSNLERVCLKQYNGGTHRHEDIYYDSTIVEVTTLTVSSGFYIDDGESGETVDPTLLLYIGGKEISAETFTLKDGTLFLGNIQGKNLLIDPVIRLKFEEKEDLITYHSTGDTVSELHPVKDIISQPNGEGILYPYDNLLNKPLDLIGTFKYGELYRFGVQLQKHTGEWSEPIFIGDRENDIQVNEGRTESDLRNTQNHLVYAQLQISLTDPLHKLLTSGLYKAIRPLVVYPSLTDRKVICQGVLCPTVFNVLDRLEDAPYSQSSWFFRPFPPANQDSVPRTHKETYVCIEFENDVDLDIESNSSDDSRYVLGGFEDSYPPSKTLVCKGRSYDNSKIWIFGKSETSSSINSVVAELASYLHNYTSIGNQSHTLTFKSWDTIQVDITEGDDLKSVTNSKNVYYKYPYRKTLYIDGDNRVIEHVVIVSNNAVWYEPLEDGSLEYRHYRSLPASDSKSAEIQSNSTVLNDVLLNSSISVEEYKRRHSDIFFVDLSIVTFHSPDLIWNTDLWSLDQTGVELRIVGYVPITANIPDIDILTETPALNYRGESPNILATVAQGFNKRLNVLSNFNTLAYKGLVTRCLWVDEIFRTGLPGYNDENLYSYGFPVYPWHRSGSINNQSVNSEKRSNTGGQETTDSEYRSARLTKKKMSNLRFSYNSIYFKDSAVLPAGALQDGYTKFKLSGLQVASLDQISITKVKKPDDTLFTYYNNVDKLLATNQMWTEEDTPRRYYPGSPYLGATHAGYRLVSTQGYPISVKDTLLLEGTMGYLNASSANKYPDKRYSLSEKKFINWPSAIPKADWDNCFGTDPIRMKYKSTPHIVMALDEIDGSQYILPIGTYSESRHTSHKPFWGNQAGSSKAYVQRPLQFSSHYGWLWLADLVRTNVVNPFGGRTLDAKINNSWIPCGKTVPLNKENAIIINWTEGDTFYQRFDCLKTYPFTLEDPNSIVDILSFMCETRINIAGRHDRNRGLLNNLVMSPTNFNLLNPVYSLYNNFFNYRILDENQFNFEDYPYTITWTKTKSAGEQVDTWTNITLASTYDLDGSKGVLTKLVNFNNNVVAFQQKAISHVLYNELMLIATLQGVPLEISNSLKVTGVRLLSGEIGCNNKHSVALSPAGIYFVDDYNKGIYLYSDSLHTLSEVSGFHSWINKVSTLNIWDPLTMKNIASYYNPIDQEVYFVNDRECLAYSEKLGRFSSFYSYEGSPYFMSLEGRSFWLKLCSSSLRNTSTTFILKLLNNNPGFIMQLIKEPCLSDKYIKYIKDNMVKGTLEAKPGIVVPRAQALDSLVCISIDSSLSNYSYSTLREKYKFWEHHKGNYNEFFGVYKPFSVTLLANPDPTLDKVFSNIEFRSDTYNAQGEVQHIKTFDTLETWNEYQRGISTLLDVKDRPSSLKKKFRIWRADIPRNNLSTQKLWRRDRMRNPWLYIKLSRENANTDKTVLHDIVLNYFV